MITQRFFGKLSDGREVFQYTISNPSASVTILNLGGIIQSLCVPDRDGKMTDVVLGYDTAQQCEENRGAHGTSLTGGQVAVVALLEVHATSLAASILNLSIASRASGILMRLRRRTCPMPKG